MLRFKAPLADLVRAGRKTQTIRLWPRPLIRVEGVYEISGGGFVRVLSMRQVTLNDLNEQDVQAEGFKSMEALLQTLRDIYGPDFTETGKRLYRVRFKYLGLKPDAQGPLFEKE